MEVRRAHDDESSAVVAVWQRARVAAGSPPSAERVDRVRWKVRDPGALVVVALLDGDVVAMAQLEPHRSLAGCGHVSMVFVDPDHQGRGVGRVLMAAAHSLAAEAGWAATSLWTRESNEAARALYRAVGYLPTDEVGATPAGEPTRRWSRRTP